mgnify:CR=1 FL=1
MQKTDPQWMWIGLGVLRKAPWNYKGEDTATAHKLKENLKRNGQVKNLIVRELGDETFEVVNGNHRIDQLAAAGTALAYCLNMGEMSELEAQRLALETNELNDPSDPHKLATMLEQVDKAYGRKDVLATLPFNDQQLTAIIQGASLNLDAYTPPPKDTSKKLTFHLTKEQFILWQKATDKAPGKEPAQVLAAMLEHNETEGQHHEQGTDTDKE